MKYTHKTNILMRRAYFQRFMRRMMYARMMEVEEDEFGTRGFLRAYFQPGRVNMNADWMEQCELDAKTQNT